MFYFEKNSSEYQIEFISGSGYEPIRNERGSVLANITYTKFSANSENALYQRKYTKRVYFDRNRNVYKTKTSKDVWFKF